MTRSSPSSHLFFFLILIPLVSPAASAALPQTQLYVDHCRRIVPDSPVTDFYHSQPKFLQLTHAYFSGGDPIFNASSSHSPNRFTFTTFAVRYTRDSDVLQFEATVYLRSPRMRVKPNGRRRLMKLRVRGPRIPVVGLGGSLSFNLHGFWSAKSGDGRAVGSGMSRSEGGTLLSHSVVFRYLNTSTLETCLMNGILESVDGESSPAFFKHITVIGISEMGYTYTVVVNQSKEDWGSLGGGVGAALGIESNPGFVP